MAADKFMKALADLQAAEGDQQKAKQDFEDAHARLQDAEKALLHAQTAFHFVANEIVGSPATAKEVLTSLVSTMVTVPLEVKVEESPKNEVKPVIAPEVSATPKDGQLLLDFPDKKPKTLVEAIEAWFPTAPQTGTASSMLKVLRAKKWKFKAEATPPQQLVNHVLWTHSQKKTGFLVKVGPGEYRRR